MLDRTQGELAVEQVIAAAASTARAADERARTAAPLEAMQDAFEKSNNEQTLALTERQFRFDSRRDLASTEMASRRSDLDRRTLELAASKNGAELNEARDKWPEVLKQRHADLERMQAEEAAVPADDQAGGSLRKTSRPKLDRR